MGDAVNAVWVNSTAGSLTPRISGSMAYDALHGVIILFGGLAGSPGGILNDTWSWDGTTWTQLHPSLSPPPRAGVSMAYDAAHSSVVLFGGESTAGMASPTPSSDTWTWDGAAWTQERPSSSPSPRSYAAMAYDPAARAVVLFGGTGDHQLGDTWTWNGATWSEQHPPASPPARDHATMAYDLALGSVVLFGGEGTPSPTIGTRLADTWLWNGTTWAQLHPSVSPPSTMDALMAYDTAAQSVLLLVSTGTRQYDPAGVPVVGPLGIEMWLFP